MNLEIARKDIYECPNCILQSDALITITWDSEHYQKNTATFSLREICRSLNYEARIEREGDKNDT